MTINVQTGMNIMQQMSGTEGNWEARGSIIVSPQMSPTEAQALQKMLKGAHNIDTQLFPRGDYCRVGLSLNNVPSEFTPTAAEQVREQLEAAKAAARQAAMGELAAAAEAAILAQAGIREPEEKSKRLKAEFDEIQHLKPVVLPPSPEELEALKKIIAKILGEEAGEEGWQLGSVSNDTVVLICEDADQVEKFGSQFGRYYSVENGMEICLEDIRGAEKAIPNFFAAREISYNTPEAQEYFKAMGRNEQADIIAADAVSKADDAARKEVEAGEKLLKLRTGNEVVLRYADEVPNRFPSDNAPTRCPQNSMLTYETRGQTMPIHANRVEVGGIRTICAQAPVSQSQEGFWRVAMENTNMILDLTNKMDRAKLHDLKRYFPSMTEGDKSVFIAGDVIVHCTQKEPDEEINSLKESVYSARVAGGEEKSIVRAHYQGWVDHCAISTGELAKIVNYVRKQQEGVIGEKPLLIHCAAGIGRTGTVVVALALAQMQKEGKLVRANLVNTINDLIIAGRQQRGPYFVQTSEQYNLLVNFGKQLVEGRMKVV